MAAPLSPAQQQERYLALASKRVMLEAGHQKAVFHWAEWQMKKHPELRWLHSVPNGAYVSKATAGKLVAEGLKAGVPDLMLDVARRGYHGLRIELKRPKTATNRAGTLDPLQKEWLQHYADNGYLAIVCYGWEHARDMIVDYLS